MKIIVRIKGGLGNQLFCYAAARRLAIVNAAELVVDSISGFSYDYAYKRRYELDSFNISAKKATANQRLEPFSRIRRFLLRFYSYLLPFKSRIYIQQEGVDFDRRLVDLKPKQDTYLDGYWQGEDYFKDIEQIIRSDLIIKPPTDSLNIEMALQIKAVESIAVHVRYFDAVPDGSQNNISHEYYERAFEYMERAFPSGHYFIFSDNPNDAVKKFKISNQNFTLVEHNISNGNALADLWLMSQCRNFIIANSTFSWWGAWLSTHEEKIIIAPSIHAKGNQMAWGFRGLLPKAWIKL